MEWIEEKTVALGNIISYGYDGLNRMTTAVKPLNAKCSAGCNMSSMNGSLGGATSYNMSVREGF